MNGWRPGWLGHLAALLMLAAAVAMGAWAARATAGPAAAAWAAGPVAATQGLPASLPTATARTRQLDLTRSAATLDDPSGRPHFDAPVGPLDAAAVARLAAEGRLQPYSRRAEWRALFAGERMRWIQLEVALAADAPRHWLLELQRPGIGNLEVFLPEPGGGWKALPITGNHHPFSTRPLAHRHFLVPLELEPGRPHAVLLRASSAGGAGAMVPTATLWQPTAFREADQPRLMAEAMFQGLLLGLLLYNLMLYLKVRDAGYLLYVGAVGCMMVAHAALSGLGAQLVWGDWVWGQVHLQRLGFAGSGLFSVLLMRHALRIPERLPRAGRLLQAGLWVAAAVAAAELPGGSPGLAGLDLGTAAFSLLLLAMCVLAVRRRWPGAAWFCAAWLASYLGLAVLWLATLGLLPANLLTTNALALGWAAALILLSLALAQRITDERRLKEDAQALAAASEANARSVAAQQALAESVARARGHFLALASHDLRQPVHALELYIGAMSRHPLPEATAGLLADARECTAGLTGMLRTVFDIAQLDAGTVPVHAHPFRLAELLERLRVENAPTAAGRGLRLRVRPWHGWVHADPVLLERVLANLVANAIRYTDRGTVLVGCRRRAGMVRIHVMDTGRGIAPQALERVFDEFYTDNTTADSNKGLGLGLAIVRRLADLMGLALGVRSEPGRGTGFWLDVPEAAPLDQPVEAARPQASEVALEGRCIVLVDDDAVVRHSFAAFLGPLGCRVVLAEGGRQALEAVATLDRVPDLVICDWRLSPTETGDQVVAALCEEFACELPHVYITAEPEGSLPAGAPVLYKPVSAQQMLDMMASLLAQPSDKLAEV